MDNADGKKQSKGKREQSLKPSNVIFFLNDEMVRLIHHNRPNDICEIYNFIKDKTQTMRYSDFRKYRKKAYTFINSARILNRSRMQFERWIKEGQILPPIGATPGGKRTFQKMSYYSEDDLFKIREMMGNIHMGRPRKDGRITPSKNIPTERELRSLLGDAIMLYTKTEDGRFIPVWQEETW